MRLFHFPFALLICCSLSALLSSAEGEQAITAQDLTIGDTINVAIHDHEPTRLRFRAETPGALTVLARFAGTDIRIHLADRFGQTDPESEIDFDYQGDPGAEQGVLIAHQAGEFYVVLSTWWGGGQGTLTTVWTPMPELAQDPVPHGSPEDAIVLSAGERHGEHLTPIGHNRWTWYKVSSPEAGQLVVGTRAAEGDLMIEAYSPGNYTTPLTTADEDRDGVAGNETLVLDISAGASLYFRVLSPWPELERIDYEFRTAHLD
ncbi:MAG: hypothetical protein EA402_12790 [Planctomycetota bacterium]|nr:MAG: hypothetical protein EA402_12790 [Planctomycetota bacterium]